MAATWPSIIPLGATTPAPAAAWATAIEPYRSSVASLSTWPASVSMPQWPWSVYSSMQRSAISTVSSPTSLTRSPSASWTMPAGSSAPEPRASLTAGMPNRTSPPTPAPTASTAALRRLSLVCCMTPGIDGTGCGSSIPSLTNSGSTRSAGRRLVCATKRRRAAVRRSLRGRTAGNPAAIGFLLTWAYTDPTFRAAARFTLRRCAPRSLPDPAAGAAAALARPAHRLAGLDRGVADRRSVVSQRVHEGRYRRAGCHHVHPEPELGGGLRRLRPDHRDRRNRVRLARDSDQVPDRRRRREQHRVEPAALYGLTDRRGWRRCPHRPVGGNVLGLPAEAGEPGKQGLGRDVGTRQQYPVDRVEHVVVGGPDVGQALGGLLLVRHQVGHDAELAQRRCRLLTDGGHLDSGKRPGVEAVLLKLFPHRADGVHRREHYPLVPAGHQALHGAFHLLRRPGRLDGDRRHLLGYRAPGLQPAHHFARLLLGPGHQHPPAEQRLGLEPGQRLLRGDAVADHGDRGSVRREQAHP